MEFETEEELDRNAIEALREKYGMGPFIATDAIVLTKDDCVLLIRRGNRPQRGKLAFPGGKLEAGQTLFECVFAELMQETNMTIENEVVTIADLEEWSQGYILADNPDRDPRAHWITKAFLFSVPFRSDQVTVTAADDALAGSAKFYAIDGLKKEDFFADHYDILTTAVYDSEEGDEEAESEG